MPKLPEKLPHQAGKRIYYSELKKQTMKKFITVQPVLTVVAQ